MVPNQLVLLGIVMEVVVPGVVVEIMVVVPEVVEIMVVVLVVVGQVVVVIMDEDVKLAKEFSSPVTGVRLLVLSGFGTIVSIVVGQVMLLVTALKKTRRSNIVEGVLRGI